MCQVDLWRLLEREGERGLPTILDPPLPERRSRGSITRQPSWRIFYFQRCKPLLQVVFFFSKRKSNSVCCTKLGLLLVYVRVASPYQQRPTGRTNPCRGNSLSRLVQLPLWGREKKKQQQVSNPLLARLNEQIGGLFFFFDQQDLKGGGAGSVLGQDPAKHPWRRPPRR